VQAETTGEGEIGKMSTGQPTLAGGAMMEAGKNTNTCLDAQSTIVWE